MSSISAEQRDRYGAFFDKLATVASASKTEYFPTRPDESAQTYYRSREADASNYISEFEGSRLADALRSQWSGRPELLSLIPELAALFEASAGDDGEEGGEVSPFIYEMF